MVTINSFNLNLFLLILYKATSFPLYFRIISVSFQSWQDTYLFFAYMFVEWMDIKTRNKPIKWVLLSWFRYIQEGRQAGRQPGSQSQVRPKCKGISIITHTWTGNEIQIQIGFLTITDRVGWKKPLMFQISEVRRPKCRGILVEKNNALRQDVLWVSRTQVSNSLSDWVGRLGCHLLVLLVVVLHNFCASLHNPFLHHRFASLNMCRVQLAGAI